MSRPSLDQMYVALYAERGKLALAQGDIVTYPNGNRFPRLWIIDKLDLAIELFDQARRGRRPKPEPTYRPPDVRGSGGFRSTVDAAGGAVYFDVESYSADDLLDFLNRQCQRAQFKGGES